MKTKKINRGYKLIVLTSVFFGFNTIGLRYYFNAYPDELPENAAFWGILGAVTLFLPVLIFSKASRKRMLDSLQRDGRVILVISVMSSFGAFLWISALKGMAAGPTSLLAKSQVIYSSLLGFFLLRERFSLRETGGILFAVSGVVAVSTLKGETNLQTSALVLASAFIYSLQSYVVKKYAPDLNGAEFSYTRAVYMAVVFLVVFSLNGTIRMVPLWNFLLLGGISVSGLMIGRAFYYESHKYLDISRLSLGMLLEPVFVIFSAWILLGEMPGMQKVAGAVLILGGLWIVSFSRINKD